MAIEVPHEVLHATMGFISNASPLISLARIGKLDLLRQLYGELFVSDAMWHQVVMQGAGQVGGRQSHRPPP